MRKELKSGRVQSATGLLSLCTSEATATSTNTGVLVSP